MALYTKPDFTFNDHNHAVIRLNRECLVELDLVPDRNNTNQYGAAVTVHNELNGDVYGESMNVPVVDGKSVIWNQLVDVVNGTITPSRATVSRTGYALNVSDDRAEGSSGYGVSVMLPNPLVASHKYLVRIKSLTNNSTDFYQYRVLLRKQDSSTSKIINTTESSVSSVVDITESVASVYVSLDERTSKTKVDGTGFTIDNLQIIDLTLLFGDGNEPEDTADARIYWIDSYLAIHPEYNTGELVRMEV